MGKRSSVLFCTLKLSVGFCWIAGLSLRSEAAPVPALLEEIPEEVLQVQVEERAYSRMDGGLRNASDYALEQKQLQIKPENVPARIAPEVKQLIDLLRIRKAILDLIPFR